ncbi:hypothetical protein Goarm_018822 [Gossypium armourianum]|uniref:Uncharacterized protein n=1 Tax=Gossypium armourianum TaxID=34283 RepID=A0A7J9IIR4_9ROSI|nr:hypothetical protein [Gossypium armourianum]
MSYNSKQGHYSYPCTDFSSPMAVIEGDEISTMLGILLMKDQPLRRLSVWMILKLPLI